MAAESRFQRAIDILTVVILAGGLFFAWDQAGKLKESIEASNRSTNISTRNTIFQQWVEIDKYMIDNPELASYFYGDKPTPLASDPNYAKINMTANYVLDFMDNTLNTEHDINTIAATQDATSWEIQFKSMFSASPLLCASMKRNGPFYGPYLAQIAKDCKER